MAATNIPAWLYRQSAVIPFRVRNGKIEILLITTRKGRWIVPKGVIEADLSASHSAAKEAREEAGVSGVLHDHLIGRYAYEKWGGTCRVQVYLLRVTKVFKTWEEDDFRVRAWLSLNEATARVAEPALKRMLKRLPAVIKATSS